MLNAVKPVEVDPINEAIANLSSELGRLHLDRGQWPTDKNARVKVAVRLLPFLKQVGTADLDIHPRAIDADRQPEVLKELLAANREEFESAMHLLRALEGLARRTSQLNGLVRASVLGELHAALSVATGRVKEVAAGLSLMNGTDEYRRLGFSAVLRPHEEPPVPDLSTLFDEDA